ncbi:MAG: hypothetical protein ACFFA3_16515 [Promethearchaeota archaeon]
MENTKQKFEEIKKSNNPEIINDFLINLSKNPMGEHLIYIRDLIENLDNQILPKVTLNLTFALGEIGNKTYLDEYFLDFLFETYHQSDRWIRNEIIQTIKKISENSELNEKIIFLIGHALNDDYIPIQFNALKTLVNLKSFPDSVFKNFLHVLNSKNSEIIEECRRFLNKLQLDENRLFNLLNQKENYKILKLGAIRALFLIQFKSIIPLETFRGNIVSSAWEKNYKDIFLNELDTFERILIKNI